ncbi:MAG TPA: hypothetical protein VL092_05480 [Chitinophagaceae bacterium]|nr:hypothetical protein [Chitinophagaceae bacterium]
MNREVSKEEIEQLHWFCKRHYVVQYDVRVELVDHLASSIEALWQKDASLHFESALDHVYRSYGTTGFRKLMKEKELAVEQAFQKGLGRAFAAMFAWPNIVIAGVLSLICIFFGSFYEEGQTFVPALFILFFCTFGVLLDIGVSVLLYRKKKQLKEPLLSTNIYSGFFVIFLLEYVLCYRLTNYLFEPGLLIREEFSRTAFLVYSAICIVCTLMSVARYRFTAKIFRQAKEVYPMAFRQDFTEGRIL